MTRTRKPTIRPQGGTDPHGRHHGEVIYNVSDAHSGALISVRREPDTQRLVIEVYRADSDVVVSAPVENLDARLVIELNTRALAAAHKPDLMDYDPEGDDQ